MYCALTVVFSMAYRVRQGRDFVTPPTGLSYTGSYVTRIVINNVDIDGYLSVSYIKWII
jgi:hypothetical protein